MASEFSLQSENGSMTEDIKTRKSLRSAVITENDTLKIKLKISKRDIVEPSKSKREGSLESKLNRNLRNNITSKGEDKHLNDGSNAEERGNEDEPKMKLRSKRDNDDEVEQKKEENVDEGCSEKKKKGSKAAEESLNEHGEIVERPVKKRGRPSKVQMEESEKLEEKRRIKRLETESSEGGKSFEDSKIPRESFCWTCHKDGSVVKCDTCPRVFHLKCVSLSKDPSKDWICPECSLVLHAEKISTRSEAMKNLSLDQLCTLLNFAIGRMKNVPESQAFWKPVDPKEVPFYDKYITNPMDLNLLEKNMKAKMYGSPQAFLADAKWLLHNSIIFNSTQSPLTSTARFLVKICKQEMAEIENCPDCYLNAHTKKEWFIEVCRKPHILIWARLKGFPFWPAKAMSTNLKTQSVDARFFGAHDKAWVPVKECYLYSKNSPQLISKKRADLDDAFLEADGYIKKIKQKYGTFCYAPDKTPFNPELYDKQLQSMIPSYQEQKLPKKKRKKHVPEENGVMEKNVQTGKKLAEHGTQHRFKLKNSNSEDSSKASDDICFMSDYISDEKILSEDKISPEDEIARSLEMYDTAAKVDGDAGEENSTDLEEDGSIPIPEHGYSRSFDVDNEIETQENDDGTVKTMREVLSEVEKVEDKRIENNVKEKKSGGNLEDKINKVENVKMNSVLILKENPDFVDETKTGRGKGIENEQRSLPSNAERTNNSCASVEGEKQKNMNVQIALPASGKRKSMEQVEEEPPKKFHIFDDAEKKVNDEFLKKEDDRSMKSFTNLSMNQKQKILTEAKLLANIDEMTASGKQKVLNELGLDASLVDIRELAQENRQILETLNKKRHNESKDMDEVPIKNEDFEQYLMEESHEENELIEQENEEAVIPRPGSIKVRDFQTLSKGRISQSSAKSSGEPKLKIMDVESLKDLKVNKKEVKLQKKKSSDDINSKKLKLEPVIELIKLDVYDKSLQKLNRKLRLSDEVSLLMVDGEKKTNVDGSDVSVKKLPGKKTDRPPRARKRMPNRTRQRENQPRDSTTTTTTTTTTNSSSSMRMSSKNINVISVDTENSNAQKNLLKSLCSEDRKMDDDNPSRGSKKTVLITTNDKGIKNVDVTTGDEITKKSMNELTIESVSNNGKGLESVKDGISLCQQKNLTVVANSHLIVTNNGPTFLTNQNNQPNLALAQNNLGQLSLVHLTNLTSGIQTNFVNLANETIGLNNSIGTIYAAPSFGSDGSCPSSSSNGSGGPVILTSSPTTGLACSAGGNAVAANKSVKAVADQGKPSGAKANASRSNAGISVKSPASLGLVTNQSGKLPPVVAKSGDEGFSLVGEVGSVTAELNRHSIKMAEYMRATIEDILRELSNQGSLEAKYKSLTIEMEKLQWRHQQEIMELKHHSERSLMELRTSLESEKQKCLAELKSQLEARHQKIISETKNKQWCANCGKEALFYCCWNTSYCDYPCQQQHWPDHMSRCAQLGNNVQASNQLQNKNLKYQNAGYVPIMSRAGGSHSSGPFTAPNRSIPTVQAQSQGRRSSDPPAPQLPINITIRPQHYFM